MPQVSPQGFISFSASDFDAELRAQQQLSQQASANARQAVRSLTNSLLTFQELNQRRNQFEAQQQQARQELDLLRDRFDLRRDLTEAQIGEIEARTGLLEQPTQGDIDTVVENTLNQLSPTQIQAAGGRETVTSQLKSGLRTAGEVAEADPAELAKQVQQSTVTRQLGTLRAAQQQLEEIGAPSVAFARRKLEEARDKVIVEDKRTAIVTGPGAVVPAQEEFDRRALPIEDLLERNLPGEARRLIFQAIQDTPAEELDRLQVGFTQIVAPRLRELAATEGFSEEVKNIFILLGLSPTKLSPIEQVIQRAAAQQEATTTE